MVAALLAICLVAQPCGGPIETRVALAAERAVSELKQTVEARFHAMDAAGHGIFNEEVTDVVAPFFPPGMTFEATAQVARSQGLSPLKLFRGKPDAAGEATYVTKVGLADGEFATVFVAVYLTFSAEDDAPRLRHASAYLRASDM